MADDRHGATVQAREPADDGGVVRERAVAVQLEEVVEDGRQVVEEVRPLGVPAELDLLPLAEPCVELPLESVGLRLERADLYVHIVARARRRAQLVDATLQLHQRFLEVEVCHGLEVAWMSRRG